MALFQPGNQASAKGRKVERMLERALLQDDDRRLREGVEKLLDLFAAGERWAMEYVRDTLDGKPKQRVDLEVDMRMSEIGALSQRKTGNIIEMATGNVIESAGS